MKGQIKIFGARRQRAAGPSSIHWQVSVVVSLEESKSYEGLVGVRQRAPNDFQEHGIILPDDLPDWVPAEHVEERVYWYFFNNVRDAMHSSSRKSNCLLTVQTTVIEAFDVSGDTWSYLGVVSWRATPIPRAPGRPGNGALGRNLK